MAHGNIIEIEPFVEALVILIIIPLTVAALTQALARRSRIGVNVMDIAQAAMVPLMMIVLAVVVGSQIDKVTAQLSDLLGVATIYVAFLIVMAAVGIGLSRPLRLNAPSSRALTFAGATRNSLVVLPLALALPEAYAIAAVAVVTQTLVELIGMVVYVRAVPRLIPYTTTPEATGESTTDNAA